MTEMPNTSLLLIVEIVITETEAQEIACAIEQDWRAAQLKTDDYHVR